MLPQYKKKQKFILLALWSYLRPILRLKPQKSCQFLVKIIAWMPGHPSKTPLIWQIITVGKVHNINNMERIGKETTGRKCLQYRKQMDEKKRTWHTQEN